MSSEASLIAKKLGSYLSVREPAAKKAAPTPVKKVEEISIWRTALSCVLMSVVIFLTKTSLQLTRWVKKLERA